MTCERFLDDSLIDVHFSSLSYVTGSQVKQLNSEDEVGNTGTHAGCEIVYKHVMPVLKSHNVFLW